MLTASTNLPGYYDRIGMACDVLEGANGTMTRLLAIYTAQCDESIRQGRGDEVIVHNACAAEMLNRHTKTVERNKQALIEAGAIERRKRYAIVRVNGVPVARRQADAIRVRRTPEECKRRRQFLSRDRAAELRARQLACRKRFRPSWEAQTHVPRLIPAESISERSQYGRGPIYRSALHLSLVAAGLHKRK